MGNKVGKSSVNASEHSEGNDLAEKLMDACEKGQVRRIRQLVEKGADVNTTCKFHTPLITTMYNRQLQSVRALIEVGADVNQRVDFEPRRDTPLSLAGGINKPEYLDLLLQAGADVNDVSSSGSTALMLAAANCHHECVKPLIKAGADVNEVDNEGNTALIYAASRHSVISVRLLLHAGAKVNIFNKMNQNALKHHIMKCGTVNRETIRIRVAAGETLDCATCAVLNTQNQLINLADYLEQQNTLRLVCREAIRKHLLVLDPHEHLFHRVPKIGLPAVITRFMLFNMSLDD